MHKGETDIDEGGHLEEGGRDEDGEDVVHVHAAEGARLVAVLAGLDPVHQPLEDGDVAVDGDVDVLEVLAGGDVPEVAHLRQQEVLRAREITLLVASVVADVDDDLLAVIGENAN